MMQINYQGNTEETLATTVAELLAAKGVDPSRVVIELDGEVLEMGSDLTGLSLRDGVALNVFRIVAGG